ncbi:MAG: hypothetical protein OEZ01_17220 [Candidatus Heimdallarchaeota archaeon]|nr:hypothetical protein [Candidatus Heimdallarchaeota archaeon]MDH5647755.1 hypothetical protein [Candidatus Heimdallarchaeota archaeon]
MSDKEINNADSSITYINGVNVNWRDNSTSHDFIRVFDTIVISLSIVYLLLLNLFKESNTNNPTKIMINLKESYYLNSYLLALQLVFTIQLINYLYKMRINSVENRLWSIFPMILVNFIPVLLYQYPTDSFLISIIASEILIWINLIIFILIFVGLEYFTFMQFKKYKIINDEFDYFCFITENLELPSNYFEFFDFDIIPRGNNNHKSIFQIRFARFIFLPLCEFIVLVMVIELFSSNDLIEFDWILFFLRIFLLIYIFLIKYPLANGNISTKQLQLILVVFCITIIIGISLSFFLAFLGW